MQYSLNINRIKTHSVDLDCFHPGKSSQEIYRCLKLAGISSEGWSQNLKVINFHQDHWLSIWFDRLQQFKYSVLSVLLGIDLFSPNWYSDGVKSSTASLNPDTSWGWKHFSLLNKLLATFRFWTDKILKKKKCLFSAKFLDIMWAHVSILLTSNITTVTREGCDSNLIEIRIYSAFLYSHQVFYLFCFSNISTFPLLRYPNFQFETCTHAAGVSGHGGLPMPRADILWVAVVVTRH